MDYIRIGHDKNKNKTRKRKNKENEKLLIDRD